MSDNATILSMIGAFLLLVVAGTLGRHAKDDGAQIEDEAHG